MLIKSYPWGGVRPVERDGVALAKKMAGRRRAEGPPSLWRTHNLRLRLEEQTPADRRRLQVLSRRADPPLAESPVPATPVAEFEKIRPFFSSEPDLNL
jgi:hypothetical protein